MRGFTQDNGKWYKVFKNGIWEQDYLDPGDEQGGYNLAEINYITPRDIDWHNVPKRQWLNGVRLLRGQVSVLSGLGGVGKTALTLTQGLSLALGKNFLEPSNTNPAWEVFSPLKVYIYGLEDDTTDLVIRLSALMDYHKVKPEEIYDSMVFSDGTMDKLILATFDGKMFAETDNAALLKDFIRLHNIDVLILDPFIKLHMCLENDNGQMDKVMVILKTIAIATKCAIWLIHHSGKSGTINDSNGARGASSIVGAARVAEALSYTTKEEQDMYGFGPDIIKLEHTKANMSDRSAPQYLRLLKHNEAQVVELAAAQDQTDRMDLFLFDNICAAIGDKVWVTTRQAKTWIGLGMKEGGISTERKADLLCKDWLEKALLIPVDGAKGSQNRELKTAIQLNKVLVAKYRDFYQQADG
jgi:hypothetical protein